MKGYATRPTSAYVRELRLKKNLWGKIRCNLSTLSSLYGYKSNPRVYWTAPLLPAMFYCDLSTRPVKSSWWHRALTLPVRDAAQTISTFCPGFGRASRNVGRSAVYWRLLSALLRVGVRYTYCARGLQL